MGGILTSLVGAAVWQMGIALWTQWRFRQGSLQGYWFEITYAPGAGTTVQSVELVSLGHHRRVVRGTMWRLMKSSHGQRWDLNGTYEDGLINAVYRCTKGNGNDGSLMLWRVSRTLYEGRFFEHAPDLVDEEVWQAKLCWVRVGSSGEDEALKHVGQDVDSPYLRRLPRRARLHLRQGLRRHAERGRDASESA